MIQRRPFGLASLSVLHAWLGIGTAVGGIQMGSSGFFWAALVFGAFGAALAGVALAVLRRAPGTVTALRAMALSLTAIGVSAYRLPGLIAIEEAQVESVSVGEHFRGLEERIDRAQSVNVRGRCEVSNQVVLFVVQIEEPNRVLVRVSDTIREKSPLTREILCDGTTLRVLEGAEVVHRGPAPPALAAYFKRALTRLHFDESPFFGLRNRSFRAPLVQGLKFDFDHDLRARHPVSAFRRFGAFDFGFVVEVGPEFRRERLFMDPEVDLPMRRTSEYRVGPAGWIKTITYDEFALNAPLELGRVVGESR